MAPIQATIVPSRTLVRTPETRPALERNVTAMAELEALGVAPTPAIVGNIRHPGAFDYASNGSQW